MYILIKLSLFSSLLLINHWVTAQSLLEEIAKFEVEKQQLEARRATINQRLESLKLQKVQVDLEEVGLPKMTTSYPIIRHAALTLAYDEEHEQARWVAHIITPAVQAGNLTRTNDFREDSLITSGTAVKADYWYSGYDRGHLAPSADFRWSGKAISESYFYSNMSPQKPEFNRERWADLERWTRGAVFAQQEQLIIFTGPILRKGLPQITQGPNKVSIPEFFYKVVVDLEGPEKKAIGFLMPNKACKYPVISYAVTIDSIEALTGIDFLSNLDNTLEEQLESMKKTQLWERVSEDILADVAPMTNDQMPKNCVNTIDAKYFTNQKVMVCGKVVATKKTQSGSIFVNLDAKFPNQIFSVTIWGSNVPNFSYSPEITLKGQKVCVKGVIKDYKGTPTINVADEQKILFLDPEEEE